LEDLCKEGLILEESLEEVLILGDFEDALEVV